MSQDSNSGWREEIKNAIYGLPQSATDAYISSEDLEDVMKKIDQLLLSQRERLRKAVDDFSEGDPYVYVHDLLKIFDRVE